MQKITKNFVKKSFEKAIENYSNAIENIGLWESEKYVINKYFDKNKSILDVGCGAGRTTFNLYEMGYKNIIGLDLTPEMISAAKTINKEKKTEIEFIVGDATDLNFEDNSFDQALFSFNGLMQIPERKNRIKALKEIKRVLTENGIFIFTTHDRENNENFKEFWEKEEKIWKEGKQDKRTYEYGDKILPSDNDDRDLFIHFPNREEIIECLEETGWKLIEDFYREDLFKENKEVKEFSTECRFWIVQK
ncbi:ubiquinone/menaquinone biosynthesis C-methylase UbiE [Halanaerobium saccharolyticum]|jgi:ubiquinone/menaquinone biosynthesis C-methylase UbiE|uniref:Ubiquinone/menaquinone biosynthesis C-methylase UbiE n=1 Tax=Halanaerobium saccharolyticum TaxID=43595 RepID=A0A4R6QZ88_9FIRM|nr:class I SAM-dependent methyltransferase [Halanaerobium saccharolyticum]TDP78632.1 ubiquinone/menaquinone biosynthesis C-methylase UbiE [Halanaerobium saccharolyticum]